MIISAPGKLVLAGEYAVLRGGLAVVAAVNRRVRAGLGTPTPSSPFLAAAAAALRDAGLADAADAIPRLHVDSSALRDASGTKLGLGSSAAATVAALGAALVSTNHPLDRALVHRLARAAHTAAQGSLGSGVDIAASTHGGVFGYRRESATYLKCHVPEVRGTFMALWTGRAADTVSLIRAVEAAGEAAEEAIAAAGAAAEALAAATDDRAVIAAIGRGADAIEALGAVAGVALMPAHVRAARGVAQRAGGELKTCGAGGGDVAIAVFPAECETTETARAFADMGLTRLDLAFDERGVDIDAGGVYLP